MKIHKKITVAIEFLNDIIDSGIIKKLRKELLLTMYTENN